MRMAKGLGFAGMGAAMGAVVMIPAAASAGTTYNSTATATAGSLTVAGKNVPLPNNTVRATDKTGPQTGSTGIGSVNGQIPGIFRSVASNAESQIPVGLNLSTETAKATPDGQSSACAGFLTADCFSQSNPVKISLPLSQIPGINLLSIATGGSPSRPSTSGGGSAGAPAPVIPPTLPKALPSGLSGGLGRPGGSAAPASGSPGSSSSSSSASPSGSSSGTSAAPALSDYTVVLFVTGPRVECAAGPAGSSGSGFTARQSPAAVSLDIQRGGASIFPNGPVSLGSGPVLGQLPRLPSALQKAGSALGASLTFGRGSVSGTGRGPSTSATAGPVSLSLRGTPVLGLAGAKAVCGPNTAAGGGTAAPARISSAETPLGGGIQTDEGHSGPGSGNLGAWAAAAGAGILGGAASGLTLWRRRRHVS